MAYEIECETCGEWFEAQRSTARYCRSACRQEAYRERKESGRVYPEEELADLRQQIWSLVRFAEYQGQGLAPLSMLADVRDPDLTRTSWISCRYSARHVLVDALKSRQLYRPQIGIPRVPGLPRSASTRNGRCANVELAP